VTRPAHPFFTAPARRIRWPPLALRSPQSSAALFLPFFLVEMAGS
jgi:hypothetical protein